jgi:hypothetical protein
MDLMEIFLLKINESESLNFLHSINFHIHKEIMNQNTCKINQIYNFDIKFFIKLT